MPSMISSIDCFIPTICILSLLLSSVAISQTTIQELPDCWWNCINGNSRSCSKNSNSRLDCMHIPFPYVLPLVPPICAFELTGHIRCLLATRYLQTSLNLHPNPQHSHLHPNLLFPKFRPSTLRLRPFLRMHQYRSPSFRDRRCWWICKSGYE